jgi:predicted transcriptional regulator
MLNYPNPPELILLKALWENGDIPIRKLHESTEMELNWSFSSTRKTVERMIEKKLVLSEKGRGPTMYRARVSKAATLAHMARDFMRRVLEIDGAVSMSLFSASTMLSDDDLDEIEGLL